MTAKKLFVVFGVLMMLFGAFPASALTESERQFLIQSILQQIAFLQSQLASLPEEEAPAFCHAFNVNMGLGSSGSEVVALNQALAFQGYITDTTAPSNGYFSEKTRIAVLAFQQRYSYEILAPLGLTVATGRVGAATRAKLNQLYGCPPLKIVFPGNGERVRVGETVRVTWEASGLGAKDTLTLSVYLTDDPFINIKTLTSTVAASKGYFDWKISNTNLPSNSYPIDVKLRLKVNKKNISVDSPEFTVNTLGSDSDSSIALRYPDSGESLHVGETIRIRWESEGLTSADRVKLSIYSSTDPDANVKIIASSVSAIQGYYDWKISNTTLPSLAFPVRVHLRAEVVSKNISDRGDRFTINSEDPGDFLSIEYPDGQTFNVGDRPRITWTSDGFIASDDLKITVHQEADPFLNVKTLTSSVPAVQEYYDWTISSSTLPNDDAGAQKLFLTLESVSKNISVSSDIFTVNVVE